MRNDKEKSLILKGNMWSVMWKLSWPAILAMVLYGLNTVLDAVFVGRFVGENALAGISLAYPLTQIPLGIGSLIGVGAGSALSIAIGANDTFTQERVLGNVNYLNIVTGVLLSILGVLFVTPLVKMMGGGGDELVYGVNYLKITLYGSLFWIAGLSGNMIVRAEGKMKSAAVMMGIGLGVNALANYIFIVVLDFGVQGAAWGTNIGMVVYSILFFTYIKRGKASFKANLFSFHRDKKIIKSIMSMGVPSFIMTVMSVVQGIVVLNAISNYGTTEDLAFYGIVFRIFLFMLTPVFGLMRALQPAVGINFGAEKYDRVISSVKVFAVGATILMLPFWVIMMVSPESVLNIMLPSKYFSPIDITNFRIFMSLLPILPVMFMAMTFFPAINRGKLSSIIGLARQFVFYVPAMLILPRVLGVSWVYKGAFLIDVILVLVAFLLVMSEFKKLRAKGVTLPVNATA